MLLRQVNLKNFRNFKEAVFDFNPFLTIIVGENARGKTNLLEAIYFLINGTGFREEKEEELLSFDKIASSVEGKFGEKDHLFNFKIILKKKDEAVEKNFFVDKVKKKYQQYVTSLSKAVLFSPEQIEIITSSPNKRRDYFNTLISFYDFEYKKKLSNYDNALRRRNRILETVYDEEKLQEELLFWNEYLEEQAVYLVAKRQAYVDFLNSHPRIDNQDFAVEYLKNELTRDKLKEIYHEERKYCRTLIGPQKDDFVFYKMGEVKKNLHHYGSRGEQRMAIIWLKLNEIKYYEDKFGKKPILLLDDVFSEFDMNNKKLIFNLVKNYQSIVTTTEIELFDLADMPKTIIYL